MLLGTIQGKITTSSFTFLAKEEIKNFEYVQVFHTVYEYVLCQIIEVTKHPDKTLAFCQVIGYKDEKSGRIRLPRIPFEPESEVLYAEDNFIASIIGLTQNTLSESDSKDSSDSLSASSPLSSDSSSHSQSAAFIGKLEGRDIPIFLDLNTVLTKHVAVLAKSGAGKSYAVAVLLEEITQKGVPLLVIDPHGEYASLAQKNEDPRDLERLADFGLEAKSFKIAEYADTDLFPNAKPLRLSTHVSAQELTHLLPGKLSANQQAVLYSALKNIKDVSFDSLLNELELEESPAKFNIVASIEYLRSLPFFSAAPTPYSELLRPGQATIINLKGIAPDVQEIIVYLLCKDLFLLRKQNKISPFFLVIEEAHNYCPERSFGETKASRILRDLASEGRKFGLGLCVVSQRPARVDKSVLSQCSTQLVLKVTNPNDLKALSSSVEGMTAEAEKEIKNLPIGSALVTGITDVPLFVAIRPRMSAHGGTAVDILNNSSTQAHLSSQKKGASVQSDNLLTQVKDFETNELLPLIKPSLTPKDIALMSEETVVEMHTYLIPAYQFACREGENRYKLLVEMESGTIIVDVNDMVSRKLPALDKFSPRELRILQTVFSASSKGGISQEKLSVALGGALNMDEELLPLLEQVYLIAQNGTLIINPSYLFTKLNKAASYDKIVYESIPYTEKRIVACNLDAIKDQLAKFTTVEDQYECFIVQYKPLFSAKK